MSKSKLTWQQKLDQGLPLNSLEEVKADADFHYKEMQREAEAKRRFEELKTGGTAAVADPATDDKKGK